MSPAKQACLNGCHHQPALAAFGVEADLDALVFGIGHALWGRFVWRLRLSLRAARVAATRLRRILAA